MLRTIDRPNDDPPNDEIPNDPSPIFEHSPPAVEEPPPPPQQAADSEPLSGAANPGRSRLSRSRRRRSNRQPRPRQTTGGTGLLACRPSMASWPVVLARRRSSLRPNSVIRWACGELPARHARCRSGKLRRQGS
jgi:hypothetical protein